MEDCCAILHHFWGFQSGFGADSEVAELWLKIESRSKSPLFILERTRVGIYVSANGALTFRRIRVAACDGRRGMHLHPNPEKNCWNGFEKIVQIQV